MDIKSLIAERYAPVVLVTGTPAAEALVQSKNGLSIVDILRPYSHVRGLNACIRVGEVSPRITELKLKFHGSNTAFQPKTEVIDEYLKDVLTRSAQKHAKSEPFETTLEQIQSGSGADPTPWYAAYRDEFLRLLGFGEHEALDHPVACIWVAPADVQDPVSHFEALKLQALLPPLMDREVMYPAKDVVFPRHYVLLHDAGSGDEKKANDNLALIARSYGAASCSLLRVNSARGTRDTIGAAPEVFKACRRGIVPGGGAGEPDARPGEPPQGLGAFLAAQDLQAVASFVQEFTSRTLLPRLEERITRLNACISATRKGLRNKLSRLWKVAGDGAASDAPYAWHSVESQMRQVADLAFLLGQYGFAAATYRLAAADYLNANNNKWYAGVEEMIGLCCIMDPVAEPNDPLKYLSRAYESYAKCPGKVNRMLATRAMMVAAAHLTSVGRHQAANHVLMRAHFEEENARAALLLEQAAFALLALQPPMVRKFAFQIVLAGLRFYSCGQKKLAIHAYRQVMSVYHRHSWRYIEEHLNDILGKQYREGGEQQRALWHFSNLLAATHRPPATQQHYVQQFLEAVVKLEAKQGSPHVMDNLALPAVNTQDVAVVYADQRCYGNVGAYAVSDAQWRRLEGPLAESDPTWLDGPAALRQTYQDEEFNSCVAGEEISVDVEFRNALQVKLKLSEVRLLAEFTPAEGEAAAAAAAGSSRRSSGGGEEQHPLGPGQQQVLIVEDRFTLHPGEVLVEQLVVRPQAAGWLRLVGVTWRVNDAAQGRAYFDIRGRRRKHPKGGRPGQQKHYPPHKRLLFNVIPAMPALEVATEALPQRLAAGEMCRCALTLRNNGSLPLRNLQLLMAGGAAVVAASNACCDAAAEECLQDAAELQLQQVTLQGGGTAHVFRFPAGLQLEPGAALRWPLWLHAPAAAAAAAAAAALEFQLLWYYEPVGIDSSSSSSSSSSSMKWRTLRMSHSVPVVPLLAVRPTVTASAQDLYRYMLRLELECGRDGEALEVAQVSCMTDGADRGWRIASLSSSSAAAAAAPAAAGTAACLQHTVQPGTALQPGDAASEFYLLQPPNTPHTSSSSSSSGEGEDSSPQPAAAAAAAAGGDRVLTGPLAFFYTQEKQAAAAAASLAALAAGTSSSDASDHHSSQQQQQQQLLSDSPVDVMLLWRTQQQQPAAARVGLLPLFNCCANVQSSLIRVLLQQQQLHVRHDFRQSPMCVAPVTLTIRNCSSLPAQLVVQTGESLAGQESQHAWFAAPTAAAAVSPLAAGASRGSLSSFSSSGAAAAAAAAGGAGSAPGSPSAAEQQVQAGLPPAPEHIWCGPSHFIVAQLAPGAVASAPLQVAVFKPGVYILDDYSCSLVFPQLGVSSSRQGEALALRVESV